MRRESDRARGRERRVLERGRSAERVLRRSRRPERPRRVLRGPRARRSLLRGVRLSRRRRGPRHERAGMSDRGAPTTDPDPPRGARAPGAGSDVWLGAGAFADRRRPAAQRRRLLPGVRRAALHLLGRLPRARLRRGGSCRCAAYLRRGVPAAGSAPAAGRHRNLRVRHLPRSARPDLLGQRRPSHDRGRPGRKRRARGTDPDHGPAHR